MNDDYRRGYADGLRASGEIRAIAKGVVKQHMSRSKTGAAHVVSQHNRNQDKKEYPSSYHRYADDPAFLEAYARETKELSKIRAPKTGAARKTHTPKAAQVSAADALASIVGKVETDHVVVTRKYGMPKKWYVEPKSSVPQTSLASSQIAYGFDSYDEAITAVVKYHDELDKISRDKASKEPY